MSLFAPHPTREPLPSVEVSWYRPKLDPALSRRLHEPSDLEGLAQTLPFLASLAAFGGGAVACAAAGRPAAAAALALLYGAQANFLINAMHELGHARVFKTPALNHVFCRVVSFLGWLHPDLFFSSHLRHHRFTQFGAPGGRVLDLENPAPARGVTAAGLLARGLVDVRGLADALSQTARAALGAFPTGHLGWTPQWERALYPPGPRAGEDRAAPIAWARVLLGGHAALAALALSRGLWLAPVIVSLGPFYSGWLFMLANSTQHAGLRAGTGVPDFRANTRSFYLPAGLLRHWYWCMNFHTEHHMFPAVPCYRLPALHEAVKRDLPPTPVGLLGVWAAIAADLAKEDAEDAAAAAAAAAARAAPAGRGAGAAAEAGLGRRASVAAETTASAGADVTSRARVTRRTRRASRSSRSRAAR